MASVINQIKLGNVEYAIAASAYAECDTDATTITKGATICTDGDTTNTAFTLVKGVAVQVKFVNANQSRSAIYLDVNNTGGKAIYYRGAAFANDKAIKAGSIHTFVYDGTYWQLVGDLDTDTNTQRAYYTSNPAMNGTASAGSSAAVSRGDHVHPTDTSRAPTSHASSDPNIYGVGTAGNYGHVKIQNGDLNGKQYVSGVVAGLGHTHGQYALEDDLHYDLIPEEDAIYNLGSGDAMYNRAYLANGFTTPVGYMDFSSSSGCSLTVDGSIGINPETALYLNPSEGVSITSSDDGLIIGNSTNTLPISMTGGVCNITATGGIELMNKKGNVSSDFAIYNLGRHLKLVQEGGEYSYTVLWARNHHTGTDQDAVQGIETYFPNNNIMSHNTYLSTWTMYSGQNLPSWDDTSTKLYAVPGVTKILTGHAANIYFSLSVLAGLDSNMTGASHLYTWLKNNGITDTSTSKAAYPCSGTYIKSGKMGALVGIKAASDTTNAFIFSYVTADTTGVQTIKVTGASFSWYSGECATLGSITGLTTIR